MRQFSKGMINLYYKVSSKAVKMIIFTESFNPDPILFSDPAPLKQVNSDADGSRSGSGSTTLKDK